MAISPGRRVFRPLTRCHHPWPRCQAPTNPPGGRARPSRSRIALHRTPRRSGSPGTVWERPATRRPNRRRLLHRGACHRPVMRHQARVGPTRSPNRSSMVRSGPFPLPGAPQTGVYGDLEQHIHDEERVGCASAFMQLAGPLRRGSARWLDQAVPALAPGVDDAGCGARHRSEGSVPTCPAVAGPSGGAGRSGRRRPAADASSSVSGFTRKHDQRPRGNTRLIAASNAWSAGSSLGRGTWRRRTPAWSRNTISSRALAASPRASSSTSSWMERHSMR